MSDNVRIVLAMIGGLLCGAAITCAVWAWTLAQQAVRGLQEYERKRRETLFRDAFERTYKKPLSEFLKEPLRRV